MSTLSDDIFEMNPLENLIEEQTISMHFNSNDFLNLKVDGLDMPMGLCDIIDITLGNIKLQIDTKNNLMTFTGAKKIIVDGDDVTQMNKVMWN